jgi:hypothetical protein
MQPQVCRLKSWGLEPWSCAQDARMSRIDIVYIDSASLLVALVNEVFCRCLLCYMRLR